MVTHFTHSPLTPAQQILVRKIAEVQLESLGELMEDQGLEAMVYATNVGVDPHELTELVGEAHQRFLQIYEQPEKFPTLNDDDLSIFKHLLFNLPKSKKLPKAARAIWKKLHIIEKAYQTGLN